MSTLSGVNNILINTIKPENVSGEKGSVDKERNSFADTVKGFINKVNTEQIGTGKQVEDIITGKSENLAEAMTALEESRLSFQLMLEMRNKLIESYQEIIRMQI